jgi:predicted cobalt transporter CbtA
MTSSLKSLRHATVLSVILTGLAASTAMAQAPAFAPPDGLLRQVSVTSLAATGLTFADERVRVPTQPLKGPSHAVRNGALWGLAAGAGVGLASITVGACEDCPGYAYLMVPGFWAGIGAAAGAGIGAIVRAAHHDDRIASNSHRTTTTVSLAPILSPKRKGVAFSMTWR